MENQSQLANGIICLSGIFAYHLQFLLIPTMTVDLIVSNAILFFLKE